MISVLITNYNTADFVGLSLFALSKLTRNPYRIIINDNGSMPHEKERLKAIVKSWPNVILNWRETKAPASQAHGEALDILMKMVDTPYTAVLDSDCTFLLKNWDEVLLNQLNDRVKIVGTTPSPARAGQRIGGGDFPLPFAVLFETKTFKDLKISCLPGNTKAGEDTCWRWKGAYTAAGYGSRLFECRNTRDYKDGPFKDLTGVEEYYFEGSLIASHFGRGSTSGEAKYLVCRWFPVLLKLLRRFVGAIEKAIWMRRCRKIVTAQSSLKTA